MKCLKNFSFAKENFHEFKRIRLLNNPEVYAEQNICIVDIDDIPEDPYIFVYPGALFPVVTTLDFLKEYVEKHPLFYLKKKDDSDFVESVSPDKATHVLRLPADTKVEDLIINGQEVLKIEKTNEKEMVNNG